MKIFYLKNKNGFPVTCVASKIVKPLAGQPMVYFDFATHNPMDRYSRAKARGTAIGRLQKHERYGVYLRSEKGETRRAVVEEIARLADSQAAREAARLWLQKYLVVETAEADEFDNALTELDAAFAAVNAGNYSAAVNKLKKWAAR